MLLQCITNLCNEFSQIYLVSNFFVQLKLCLKFMIFDINHTVKIGSDCNSDDHCVTHVHQIILTKVELKAASLFKFAVIIVDLSFIEIVGNLIKLLFNLYKKHCIWFSLNQTLQWTNSMTQSFFVPYFALDLVDCSFVQ